MNCEIIKNKLYQLSDEKYKEFSISLFKNPPKMLGVRLIDLRKIAKEIAAENIYAYLSFPCEFFEETMIQGMSIGYYKGCPNEILKLVEGFIPKITNWSICDSFCSSLKFTNKNKPLVWNFIKRYSNSKKEFEERFFFVMALNYFVSSSFIEEIFEILNKASFNGYYAKMGAAWLISKCFTEFSEETFKFLSSVKIDKEVFYYSIQKIKDSHKIDNETKLLLKNIGYSSAAPRLS